MDAWLEVKVTHSFLSCKYKGLPGSAEQFGVILTQAARARSVQYSPYPDFIRSASKDLNLGKTRDLPFGNSSGMACVIL